MEATQISRSIVAGPSAGKQKRGMRLPNLLKTGGYLISSISVLLLGAAAWRTAQRDSALALCLIGGMAASIAGMVLRWASYQLER